MTINRSEGRRKTNNDFPPEALRAVIANAIIHRDYSIEQSTNYLYISPMKIIARSPGLPVQPLTIDDLRTMDIPSISRNPKIMYVYNRMGLAEQRGIGLRSLRNLPKKGFPLPEFNLKGNLLDIVFPRDKSDIAKVKGLNHLDLSDEDKEGLYFIQKEGQISASDYAERLGINKKTAQRRLSDLIEKGIIEKIGEKRWTVYKIK